MSLTKWMNQCFHYYYCYTNNNRISATRTTYDENSVGSGVASSANNKHTSTNNNSNNNKITLILILSIISTSTSVLAADDYFEIRVDPLGKCNKCVISNIFNFRWSASHLTHFWLTNNLVFISSLYVKCSNICLL